MNAQLSALLKYSNEFPDILEVEWLRKGVKFTFRDFTHFEICCRGLIPDDSIHIDFWEFSVTFHIYTKRSLEEIYRTLLQEVSFTDSGKPIFNK